MVVLASISVQIASALYDSSEWLDVLKINVLIVIRWLGPLCLASIIVHQDTYSWPASCQPHLPPPPRVGLLLTSLIAVPLLLMHVSRYLLACYLHSLSTTCLLGLELFFTDGGASGLPCIVLLHPCVCVCAHYIRHV
jgi:hypothetical protein